MALKRTISFEDLDGEETSEDWYFSLTESDVADMDLAHQEDVPGYLADVLKRKDSKTWLTILKDIIFASVGKREGKLLVKDDEVLRQFKYGGAYKQLFAELIETDDAGGSFFQSILPANVRQRVQDEINATHTKDDLLAMTDEEFARVAGTDITEMTKEHMQIAWQRKNSKSDAA